MWQPATDPTSPPTNPAEAPLARTEAVIDGQKRALELAMRGAPLGAVLEVLVRTIEAHSTRGVRGSILLLDAEGRHLRHGAAPSLPEPYNAAIDGIAIGPAVGSCGTAAYGGRTVVVSDIETDPLWKDFKALALEHGLRACWSTPILSSRGTVLGTFALYHPVPALPSDRDCEIVELLGRTATLVIERDRALSEVAVERARLHDVFMQAPAAIAVLEGHEHVFKVANARYRELVGGRDVEGRRLLDALPELAGQGFAELLDGVRATGQAHVAHEALVKIDRNRDGVLEDIYVDFVYQPLTQGDGTVFGIMVHAVETTAQVVARQQAEQRAAELLHLTEALAASNRELDQFAYVASHDLKAPLRGISSLAHWLEEDLADRLDDDSRQHLTTLKGRVARMDALIDGILAYSRAGRARAQPEPIDTGVLLRETVDLLAPGEAVRVELPAVAPVIHADRVTLEQIFLNLIGNAIKYTRPFRPDPVITVHARDAGDHWEFAVSDNGPGIAPEYHARVWEIFQTLAARDRVEGTGIGLAVVKKIVEARGGRAWLESVPDHGATFYFTWRK